MRRSYQDKKSPSIYVSFPVKDGLGVIDEDVNFLIWTTTPWTIPANLGISVHPEFDYVIVKAGEEKFLIAKDLLSFVAEELGWEDYAVERELKGSELDRVVAKHPLYDRDSLVMLGDQLQPKRVLMRPYSPGHGKMTSRVQPYGIDALFLLMIAVL